MDSKNKKIIENLNKAKAALADFAMRARNLFRPGQDLMSKQDAMDKRLVFSLAKSRVPNFRQLKYVKKFLSGKELWIINICLIVLLICSIISVAGFYKNHFKQAPKQGGSYSEALIGAPKYINPLYAKVNDVDNDLVSLIYSSLLKRNGNGDLVSDLAESYSASDDGKIYRFKIRQGVKWHDGVDLTVDDVLFTFGIIKDKQYGSPLRAGFSGVEIRKIDNQTIEFVLSDSYAAFLELLDFGIMPRVHWEQIPANASNLAELNLKPIGSGPYKFKSLVKDKSGNLKSYKLEANTDYYGKAPYIEELNFIFFPDFASAVSSLNAGNTIDAVSYIPEELKTEIAAQEHWNFYHLNMPQISSLFFNESENSAASDKKVRQAMSMAIDKNQIVEKVFGDSAKAINGPILPDSFAYSDCGKYGYNREEAAKLLDSAGWQAAAITKEAIASAKEETEVPETKKANEAKLAMGEGKWRMKGGEYLAIKLTAVENQDNQKIAEMIKDYCEEAGIKTTIELIPSNQIQSEVIKPRNFSVLLYGVVTGADPDQYVFWHSSQIDGGLNWTGFSNKEADQLLEDARLANNVEIRKEKYKKFQEIIAEEMPAIFLYSQAYNYVQSKKIKGFGVKKITLPRGRFADICEWYTETGKKFSW